MAETLTCTKTLGYLKDFNSFVLYTADKDVVGWVDYNVETGEYWPSMVSVSCVDGRSFTTLDGAVACASETHYTPE